MEHYLFALFLEFIRSMNRRTQKPVTELTSDTFMLHSNPLQTLGQQPVYVGPWRKRGSVLAVTLLASLALWGCVCAGSLDFLNLGGRNFQGLKAALLIGMCLGGPLILAIVSRRCIYGRAGEAVLTVDGIAFTSRHEKVFCPWSVFDTPGVPVRYGLDRVIVPVADDAVKEILIERHGRFEEEGQVKTRPVTSRAGTEIELLNLYDVDIFELASLFLHLGRTLNKGVIRQSQSTSTVSPTDEPTEPRFARLEKNGWMRVRLTRLSFPPRCCGCGELTDQWQVVVIQKPFFALDYSTDLATLTVPVCTSCQKFGIRRGRKYLAMGCATTALLLVGLCFLMVLLGAANIPMGVVLTVLVIGLGIAVLFTVRGSILRKRWQSPVEVHRYSPREGTVSLRFRHPGYAELLIPAN